MMMIMMMMMMTMMMMMIIKRREFLTTEREGGRGQGREERIELPMYSKEHFEELKKKATVFIVLIRIEKIKQLLASVGHFKNIDVSGCH